MLVIMINFGDGGVQFIKWGILFKFILGVRNEKKQMMRRIFRSAPNN